MMMALCLTSWRATLLSQTCLHESEKPRQRFFMEPKTPLFYAAKDPAINHAVMLAELLSRSRLEKPRP
jgi:hypothetical protein